MYGESAPAILVKGLGKRYRLGRSGGVVPVPLFGDRLSRYERRDTDEVDDDELNEDDDEPVEPSETARRDRPPSETWALRGLGFAVAPGGALGLVGPAGSGKSTLLKVLGRVTPPTEGRVELRGRVAPVLGSLAGLVVGEVSVRSNVAILGRFLGTDQAVMARRAEAVVRFAGLEDLAGRKAKHLSPGMRERLAFAAGLNLDVDVILADERIATGEQAFQERCLARIEELRAQGAILVFASKRLQSVTELCTEALWLQDGCVRAHGPVEPVVDAYSESLRPPAPATMVRPVAPPQRATPPPAPEPTDVFVCSTRLLGAIGEPVSTVPQGGTVVAEIEIEARAPDASLLVLIGLKEGEERLRFVTPEPHVVERVGRHVVRASLILSGLSPGSYVGGVHVLVNRPDGRPSDLVRLGGLRFTIEAGKEEVAGSPSASWTISGPEEEPVASASPSSSS